MIMRNIKLLLAAFLCSLVLSIDTASAQYAPCPGGRMMGQECGNGFCVPVCVYDTPATPAPEEAPQVTVRPKRYLDTDASFAIVWHNNASDVWAVWNTKNPEQAEKQALANCNAVMRSGCTIAVSGTNSSGNIVKGGNGMMTAGWGERSSDAWRQALQKCEQSNPTCYDFRTFFGINVEFTDTGERLVTGVGVYSPKVTPDLFHKYAVMAFVTSREAPFKETAWISSGNTDIEQARSAALTACQNESAKPCQVGAYTANGKIYIYRFKKGELFAFSEQADENGAEFAKKECKKRKVKCTIVAAYDSKLEGMVKQDFLNVKPKK
jgi:hypothetical protein